MKKKFRILFANEASRFNKFALMSVDIIKYRHGVETEIIYEKEDPRLPCDNCYTLIGPEYEEGVQFFTTPGSPGKVDLVIIGNNNGSGILKARAVHPDMRKNTIICWVSYPDFCEHDEEYKKMGINMFSGYNKELSDKILEFFEREPQPA